MKNLSAAAVFLMIPGLARAQEVKPVSPLAPPLVTWTEPTVSAGHTQQFYLRRLNIVSDAGIIRTKEILILHMIPLSEGDLFDQTRWDAGIEQLDRSGLFKPIARTDVVMKPDPAAGLVDVDLHLTEVDHRRIDFSGGGGTTGGASGAVDYSDINVTGRGDRLRARLILGTREQTIAGQYSLSLISQRQPVFDFSGFFQRSLLVNAMLADGNRDPLFITSSAGASVGLQFALGRARYSIAAPTRIGVDYSFSSTSASDRFSTSIISISSGQERLRTATLTLFLIHDTLDRQFDPQQGERLSLGFEAGARTLGGSVNTAKPFFDYRRFYSLGRANAESNRERQTVGVRFRAAHISSFGERFHPETLSTVGGVPLFKRFFTGGEEEVRGYDVNSIAPLARVERFIPSSAGTPSLVSSEVRPIGGDTQLLFNAEYRIPLVWRLSAAAFFDIGSSFNASRLTTESFLQSVPNPPFGTVDVTTVLSRAGEAEFQLPSYRCSLGGEIRLPIPVLNIPIRLIFAGNPNAQTNPPAGALVVPEKRFAFRIGFSRTL